MWQNYVCLLQRIKWKLGGGQGVGVMKDEELNLLLIMKGYSER